MSILKAIQDKLYALQDTKYRDFQGKLIPTVDPKTIIGVRTPDLRTLAKELAKQEDIGTFLDTLPHTYFDENQLHAFILSELKDYNQCIERVKEFLPYIDNWATCDSFTSKVFGKHPDELLKAIDGWIVSNHTYTVRYAIRMLMAFFLDERFKPEYAQMVAAVKSEEYYIKMMIAWYFATALAKQYDATIGFIRNRRLAPWTHNKAIQKAVESYRVSEEHKQHLKTLKNK